MIPWLLRWIDTKSRQTGGHRSIDGMGCSRILTPQDKRGDALPNGPGTQAQLGSAITSAATITLDEDTITGDLTFNSPNAYTITPGSLSADAETNSLILDNGGNSALITAAVGAHNINVC